MLQHLRGHDDRLAVGPSSPDDALLGERHFLRRQFNSKVPPGDHDRIGELNDGVQLLERLGFFDLRDDPGPSVRYVACFGHVLRALNKAQTDEIHALVEGKHQVLLVLLGQRRNLQHHVRHVHALPVAQGAADHHFAVQMAAAVVVDPQAELAVVQKQRRAAGRGGHDFRVRQLDASGSAGRRVGIQAELLAGLQMHTPATEPADAQFWTLHVGKQADRPAGRLLQGADRGNAGRMIGMAAMREIKPEYVGAGMEKARNHLVATAGRAERGDDLGLTMTAQPGLRSHGVLAPCC
jgi:hypothetical protein